MDSSNGILGERYAANYLRKKGYAILTVNFRTRFGEIDVIAQKDDVLCFVEVKTRSANFLLSPSEAVDYRKQNRIIKAALQYISTYGYTMQPRFDVIEIITQNGQSMDVEEVKHIENAFDLSKIKDVYI